MSFLRFPSSPDPAFETLPRLLGHNLPRRRVFALLAAALASGTLASRVAAERVPALGVSIADRVKTQKETCKIDDGIFSERQTAFGSTITTCKGGNNPQTCVHTKQSTDCHKPFTGAPGDVAPPPSGGVLDPPSGGAGTWVVEGAVNRGQAARTATAHRAHAARTHRGRSKHRRHADKRKP